MRLDAATFLLQWSVGGLAFLWFTLRSKEISLGYSKLLRATYGVLAALDFGVEKLFHAPAVHAHQVVVVLAFVEFVHRLARLEVAAREQAGLLELHQHAVHRGQTNVGMLFEQHTVDIFGRHVALLGVLEHLQNLQARQRGFESRAFQFIDVGHGRGCWHGMERWDLGHGCQCTWCSGGTAGRTPGLQ